MKATADIRRNLEIVEYELRWCSPEIRKAFREVTEAALYGTVVDSILSTEKLATVAAGVYKQDCKKCPFYGKCGDRPCYELFFNFLS